MLSKLIFTAILCMLYLNYLVSASQFLTYQNVGQVKGKNKDGKDVMYKLGAFIAEGSLAGVFELHADNNTKLSKSSKIAVKVEVAVIPETTNVTAAQNEIFILEKLNAHYEDPVSKGVLKMYDHIRNDGLLYTLRMTFQINKRECVAILETRVDMDLSKYIGLNSKSFLTEANTKKWLHKLAVVLQNLHDADVLHNDFAVGNIGVIGEKLVALDYGISTEIKKPNRMIYIELVPTDISSFEWPMGKKEVLSRNAIECKEREVADDWWSFYCDGHKFYDSEDPKEPTTEDKVTRLPWDYYSVQRFWNLNTRVGKERAVDMTTELMKKYSNLSKYYKERNFTTFNQNIGKLLHTVRGLIDKKKFASIVGTFA